MIVYKIVSPVVTTSGYKLGPYMRVQYMVRHMVRIEVYIPSGIRRLDKNFEFLIVQQPSTDVVAVCCGVFFCQLNSLNTPEMLPGPHIFVCACSVHKILRKICRAANNKANIFYKRVISNKQSKMNH